MATNHVDFTIAPGTDEDNADAIAPHVDGERGNAATFNRPLEILRVRTETLRQSVESLNAFADSGHLAMQMSDSGQLNWSGPYGEYSGTLTLENADLQVRPLLAPAVSTPATLELGGIRFSTYTLMPAPYEDREAPHAYNGANRITVELLEGAELSAVVAGAPQDNIQITYSAGTTAAALATFVNESLVCRAAGVRAEAIEGPVIAGVGTLSGATDAEIHVITRDGLLAFFQDAENCLRDGDVLAIRYDTLVSSASRGGRHQSLPEHGNTNCDANLFVLRRNPEYAVHAIPLAVVSPEGLLLLANGTALAPHTATTLQVFATKFTPSYISGAASTRGDPTTGYAFGDHVHGVLAAAIQAAHLVDGAVTTAKIAEGAVTPEKIAYDAIDGDRLASGSVTDAHVAAAANISASKVRYGGTGPWADGTLNLPTSVEEQLTQLVTGLSDKGAADYAGGAAKIGSATLLRGGLHIPEGTLREQLENFLTQLSLAAFKDNGNYFTKDQNITGEGATPALTVTSYPDSTGVRGVGTGSGTGVTGTSTTGTGVYGSTNDGVSAAISGRNLGDGPGVKGASEDLGVLGCQGTPSELNAVVTSGKAGVEGVGKVGVKGYSTSAGGAGVEGTSLTGAGVSGNSTGGTGVQGTTHGGIGVKGVAGHAAGLGVSGENMYGTGVRGKTDAGIGVEGLATDAAGTGVSGSGPGVGVHGTGGIAGVHGASADGYGGVFEGNVKSAVHLEPQNQPDEGSDGDVYYNTELFSYDERYGAWRPVVRARTTPNLFQDKALAAGLDILEDAGYCGTVRASLDWSSESIPQGAITVEVFTKIDQFGAWVPLAPAWGSLDINDDRLTDYATFVGLGRYVRFRVATFGTTETAVDLPTLFLEYL